MTSAAAGVGTPLMPAVCNRVSGAYCWPIYVSRPLWPLQAAPGGGHFVHILLIDPRPKQQLLPCRPEDRRESKAAAAIWS